MPGSEAELPATAGGLSVRLRRFRRTPALRDWVAETDLAPRHLVYPIFVAPRLDAPEPIPSMPGVSRLPVSALGSLAPELERSGIPSVLIFGVARAKDEEGSDAWSADGVVAEAVRAIKAASPATVVVTDVCLCAYTTHGHCGVRQGREIDNDASTERLGRVAVAHASAGADVVAPSAMMDGQVRAVRRALDAAGHPETAVLSYATKHASSLYNPFRDAEDSAPAFGDRRGYQMDYRNAREALREMALDVEEGADALMVKPGITSLDLLARARERFLLPLAAYQVSGEYAMIKAAAAKGVVDERALVLETVYALRRAGADLVVTYFARDIARWLAERR